jgi:predicted DNA-binding transcriptional regulator YafY
MNNIELIEQAINDGKQISFDYQSGKDTEASLRRLHAWMLAERKDTTYLIGHQGAGGSGYAIRQYKLDGLQNLKIEEADASEFPDKAGDPAKWDKIIVETAGRAPIKEKIAD